MINNSTIEFFRLLSKNNNKAWFDANRRLYFEAKDNFSKFVEILLNEIVMFDGTIHGLQPKNCIFRINRDIRFSSDKSPYRVYTGAVISKGGRNSGHACYYFHLEPNNKSFLAGGMYLPPTPILNPVRQEIDYHTSEFKKIITNKTFTKYFKGLEGEKLKSAPKGYAKNHPEIELLKYKSYIVANYLKDKQLMEKDFLKYTIKVFKEMKPFICFLNRALN